MVFLPNRSRPGSLSHLAFSSHLFSHHSPRLYVTQQESSLLLARLAFFLILKSSKHPYLLQLLDQLRKQRLCSLLCTQQAPATSGPRTLLTPLSTYPPGVGYHLSPFLAGSGRANYVIVLSLSLSFSIPVKLFVISTAGVVTRTRGDR